MILNTFEEDGKSIQLLEEKMKYRGLHKSYQERRKTIQY